VDVAHYLDAIAERPVKNQIISHWKMPNPFRDVFTGHAEIGIAG
jgi:hypothetical protein